MSQEQMEPRGGTPLHGEGKPHSPPVPPGLGGSSSEIKSGYGHPKGRHRHLTTRCLTEGAILVAMAQVLGYLKLYELPQGGSITLAMFPVLFFSIRWGLKAGLLAGFAYGCLQLIFDGAYAWGWQSMVMDYLLAFTPLGLAGLFQKKPWGIYVGTILGCLGRFLVHFVAGVTLWAEYAPEEFGSPAVYSLVYNGSYMLPCTLVALVMAGLLHKPLGKYYLGEDIARN